jgi:hypothetical protein
MIKTEQNRNARDAKPLHEQAHNVASPPISSKSAQSGGANDTTPTSPPELQAVARLVGWPAVSEGPAELAVAESTRKLYLAAVCDFGAWVDRVIPNLAALQPVHLDLTVYSYMTYLFQLDFPAVKGERLIAGLNHLFPSLRGTLATCSRALRGWRAHFPGNEGEPIALESVGALCSELEKAGEHEASDIVTIAFDLLLRGGEFKILRAQDVYSTDEGDVAVVLPTTKTGPNKGIVALSPQCKKALIKWKEDAVAKGRYKLFCISRPRFAKVLDEAALRVPMERITPHVFRHTGASFLAAPPPLGKGMREEDLALRGRWKSLRSVERYFKPATLIRAASMLTPEAISKGRDYWACRQLLLEL